MTTPREPAATRSSQRPAFIVGSDRSGTTLLRLVMNGHSRLSSPAETWFLIDLMDHFGRDHALDRQELSSALDIIFSRRRAKNFGVSREELGAALAAHETVSIDQIFDAFMRLETGSSGAQRWIDKTPEYVLHLSDLAHLFPTAQFISITRDGRDVFASLLPRRWRGRSAWKIGRYWAQCIDNAAAAAADLPTERWLSITYEELVLDLAATTGRICEFLEVDYEPAMIGYHQTAVSNITEDARARGLHDKLTRPPEPDDVYRWKRSKTTLRGWLFEGITRRQLHQAGYETRVPAWTVPGFEVAALLEHVVTALHGRIEKRIRAWLQPTVEGP